MNVLIIGGNCDIGICLSEMLINDGYNIISTYFNNDSNIDNLINKYNNKITKYKVDITNESDIKKLYNKIDNADILIILSAICKDNNYLDKTKEEFMDVLETNLVGPFLCVKYLEKKIKKLIICFSSTDGIDTYSELSIDYSASKAGLISLVKTFSLILKDKKIISVAPNWVNTSSVKEMSQEYLNSELKRINQPRLIEVEEVGKQVLNLIKSKDLISGDNYRIEGYYDRY